MPTQTDQVSAFAKFMERYRFTMMGIVFSLAILCVPLGCQSKGTSPFNGKQVSDVEMIAQGEAYVAQKQADVVKIEADLKRSLASIEAQYKAGLAAAGADAETAMAMNAAESQAKAAAMEAALKQIEQKKQAIQMGLESIASIGATAAGPGYAPIVMSAFGLASLVLGIGTTADNKRKDKVIADLKGSTPGPHVVAA